MDKVKFSPYQKLRILVILLRFWVRDRLYGGFKGVKALDTSWHEVLIPSAFLGVLFVLWLIYAVVTHSGWLSIAWGGAGALVTIPAAIFFYRQVRKTAQRK